MPVRPRFDPVVSPVRRLRVAERVLWGAGLLLIVIYLAVRGYGEAMRRWELRRFEAARHTLPSRAESIPPAQARPALRAPSTVDTRLWSPQRVRGYRESLRDDLGHPLAVLRIPRIGLEVPVLDGTDEPRLNRGVGRIEGTAHPGQAGNLGIAGHRDGFFRGLKDVEIGDTVELETLEGAATYLVDDIRIVDPADVSVLRPTASPVITMVTCYPFYYVGSAPRRYIVRARAEGAAGVPGKEAN
jgi:sortase A